MHVVVLLSETEMCLAVCFICASTMEWSIMPFSSTATGLDKERKTSEVFSRLIYFLACGCSHVKPLGCYTALVNCVYVRTLSDGFVSMH
jgi:hypothetical protein